MSDVLKRWEFFMKIFVKLWCIVICLSINDLPAAGAHGRSSPISRLNVRAKTISRKKLGSMAKKRARQVVDQIMQAGSTQSTMADEKNHKESGIGLVVSPTESKQADAPSPTKKRKLNRLDFKHSAQAANDKERLTGRANPIPKHLDCEAPTPLFLQQKFVERAAKGDCAYVTRILNNLCREEGKALCDRDGRINDQILMDAYSSAKAANHLNVVYLLFLHPETEEYLADDDRVLTPHCLYTIIENAIHQNHLDLVYYLLEDLQDERLNQDKIRGFFLLLAEKFFYFDELAEMRFKILKLIVSRWPLDVNTMVKAYQHACEHCKEINKIVKNKDSAYAGELGAAMMVENFLWAALPIPQQAKAFFVVTL